MTREAYCRTDQRPNTTIDFSAWPSVLKRSSSVAHSSISSMQVPERIGDHLQHVFVYHFLYGRSEHLHKPLLIRSRLRCFYGGPICCGML